MIGTLLIVLMTLLGLGSIPAWPYSRGSGYEPERRARRAPHGRLAARWTDPRLRQAFDLHEQ